MKDFYSLQIGQLIFIKPIKQLVYLIQKKALSNRKGEIETQELKTTAGTFRPEDVDYEFEGASDTNRANG